MNVNAINNFIPPVVGVILNVYSLIAGILGLIGLAKIFTKAGEPWWKVLIPIYNDYIFSKIIKGVNLFIAKIVAFILYFLGLIIIGISVIVALSPSGNALVAILLLVAWILIFIIAIIVIEAMWANKLAKAFGQGVWYAVGYFFFPFIFTLLYGFGNYEYQYGEKENKEENIEDIMSE